MGGNSLKFMVAAVLGLSIAAARDSQAAANRVYQAVHCVQRGDITPEIEYSWVGAFNKATSTKLWICPVIRDNVASSMDILDWDVTVHRRASALAWDIELWSTDNTGNSGFSSTITVPTPDGYQDLDGGTITSAFTEGKLYIQSNVPPAAQISRYHVQES